jgi:hypothetical protein
MSGNKTIPTEAPVEQFLSEIPDEQKRRDCRELVELMSSITGKQPKMWGGSMVGFGQYHYRYESGREGDFFLTGFAPRKAALTVYVMAGFSKYEQLMKKLGPHKTGKSCLYLKSLDAVDRDVLADIIRDSVARMRARYNCS